MIYFDTEYNCDSLNKIDYINLKLVLDNAKYSQNLYNVKNIYESENNNVLLVEGETNFYTSNVYFCKKIGINLYKVIINEPPATLKTMSRLAKSQNKSKKIS